jgi:hypothetical protein
LSRNKVFESPAAVGPGNCILTWGGGGGHLHALSYWGDAWPMIVTGSIEPLGLIMRDLLIWSVTLERFTKETHLQIAFVKFNF